MAPWYVGLGERLPHRGVGPDTPPPRVDLHTPGVAAQVVGQAVLMAREIPEVVRAAAGLAATVLDEARKLPETLPVIGLGLFWV